MVKGGRKNNIFKLGSKANRQTGKKIYRNDIKRSKMEIRDEALRR